MDARYKDTHAYIKAIKASLLQTTGKAPPTVLFLEKAPPADAKKGEKMQQLKKKGYDDGLYIEPDAASSMLANIPKPDGSKKIDETLNALAEEKARIKRDMEAKGASRLKRRRKI
ncbi:hypothetical protein Hanom_Chr07g00587851 [Helianthus anomalus]